MQKLKAYQKFPVDLFDISMVFSLLGKGVTDRISQMSETGFGDNKIRGIKEYLADFGLLGEKNNITPFGQIIMKHDGRFREPFTRWLLVYHWSLKENNPYLYFLINHSIGITGEERKITRFKAWAEKNDVKTDYEGDMLDVMIRNTDNSFLENNAFSNLNLFFKSNGTMERAEPYMVEPHLVAYILYLNRYNRTSIGFSELLRADSNIAKFFNLDRQSLDQRIVELNNMGLTRLIQYADLHMIEFTYEKSADTLLEQYYNGD